MIISEFVRYDRNINEISELTENLIFDLRFRQKRENVNLYFDLNENTKARTILAI